MSIAITELELTDVNTISIPTDTILLLSLLIIFALVGYFFHKIVNTQTNRFVKKVDNNLNLELFEEKLEDQLIPDSKIVIQKKAEKPSMKKLNFLLPSKLLGVRSMAVVAIGGASLLGIQAMQSSYQRVNTSQVNIKAKKFVSMFKLKSLEKAQNQIKKISYVDPLLSAIHSSKKNNFYQFKASKKEDFFSF